MKKIKITVFTVLLVFSMLFGVSCSKTTAGDLQKIEVDELNAVAGYDSETEDVVSLSISDVNKIIAAAKEAYMKNDNIVISDEVTIDPVSVPVLSLQTVEDMEDADDPRLDDFLIYTSDTVQVIESMLKDILPETAVIELRGKTNFPHPNYYFFDLEKAGFESAEDAFEKLREDDSADVDKITDCVYVLNGCLYYYEAETDESTCLYPNTEERELVSAIFEKKQTAVNSDPNYLIEKYAKSAAE